MMIMRMRRGHQKCINADRLMRMRMRRGKTCQQIMRMMDIFPSSLKGIKASGKPGRGDEELDLPGKYKIKEVLGEVLTWLLRVPS